MSEALWFAGLAVANLWLAGSLGYSSNTEKGMLGGAAVGAGAGALIGRGNPAAGLGGVVGAVQLSENQPWVADQIEDRRNPKNDARMPIGPALKPGVQTMCDEPPDTQEILRAMPKSHRGIPFVYEQFRDDIEITTEKLVDRIDPPRFFPLVGSAQLHHCHWKCTVHFTETIDVHYPVPMKTQRKCSEVIYIDKDRLVPCAAQEKLGGVCMEPISPTVTQVEPFFLRDVEMVDDHLNMNQKIPGLRGRVWLHTEDGKSNYGDGTITVEMYHQDPAALGKPQLLSVWKFDAATLKTLQSKDKIGPVYKLFLPCDPEAAHVKKVKLEVKYTPKAGTARSAASTVLNLRYADQQIVQAGQTEESAAPPLPRLTRASQPNTMTLTDVARLAQRGISEDIILRQMDLTGATFRLTVEDILSLHEQGVSENIIRVIQMRAMGAR